MNGWVQTRAPSTYAVIGSSVPIGIDGRLRAERNHALRAISQAKFELHLVDRWHRSQLMQQFQAGQKGCALELDKVICPRYERSGTGERLRRCYFPNAFNASTEQITELGVGFNDLEPIGEPPQPDWQEMTERAKGRFGVTVVRHGQGAGDCEPKLRGSQLISLCTGRGDDVIECSALLNAKTPVEWSPCVAQEREVIPHLRGRQGGRLGGY
jgi:hypothetical protein